MPMDSLRKAIELEKQLVDAGSLLLTPPTAIDELVALLDKVMYLLADIEQMPSRSLQDALVPSMKALVADELLRHPDNDVRVSVASCISEITRISAPDPPYDDEHMREIFQLFVATLQNLCHVSGRCYTKALSILETIAKVRSCLVMLDLECDAVIIEMFRHFLKITRSNHSDTVITAIEAIMILVIDESEDVSWDLLNTLLASVRKESQDVYPISWNLGEKVITNCAAKLKPYLLEAVQSRGIAVDEYAEIVTYICKGGYKTLQHDHLNGTEENLANKELDSVCPGEVCHDVDGNSKSMASNETASTWNEDSFMNDNSSKVLEHCSQTENSKSTSAKDSVCPGEVCHDVDGIFKLMAIKKTAHSDETTSTRNEDSFMKDDSSKLLEHCSQAENSKSTSAKDSVCPGEVCHDVDGISKSMVSNKTAPSDETASTRNEDSFMNDDSSKLLEHCSQAENSKSTSAKDSVCPGEVCHDVDGISKSMASNKTNPSDETASTRNKDSFMNDNSSKVLEQCSHAENSKSTGAKDSVCPGEVSHDVDVISKSMVSKEFARSDETASTRNDDSFMNDNSSKVLEHCSHAKNSKSTSARGSAEPENLDHTRTVRSDTKPESAPKKRARKPNSLMNPEEGYEHYWISTEIKAPKEPGCRKSHDKEVNCSPIRNPGSKKTALLSKHEKVGQTVSSPPLKGNTADVSHPKRFRPKKKGSMVNQDADPNSLSVSKGKSMNAQVEEKAPQSADSSLKEEPEDRCNSEIKRRKLSVKTDEETTHAPRDKVSEKEATVPIDLKEKQQQQSVIKARGSIINDDKSSGQTDIRKGSSVSVSAKDVTEASNVKKKKKISKDADDQTDIRKGSSVVAVSDKYVIEASALKKKKKISRDAAKSSKKDGNCSDETPKTEVKRKHPVAKQEMMSKAPAQSSNGDGNCSEETPKTEVKRKHPVPVEVTMSKAAAKSSDRDENCSEETPKTELNREHCVATEVMSKAATKSSDSNGNCSDLTPKTEVNTEHPVAEEVKMMSKDAAKSSNRNGDCTKETPKTEVKRKHSVAKEVNMMSKGAAKSSDRDRDGTEETPKTEVKRKHPAVKDVAAAKSSNRDGSYSEETPPKKVKRKHRVAKEVMMSKSAAKSSDRDKNCSEETPKTEVNREHCVAKEVPKAAAKPSDGDENRSEETPKTEVNREHSVAKDVVASKGAAKSSKSYSEETPKTEVKRRHPVAKEVMIAKAAAKSSKRDGSCSEETPKKEVKRKHPIAKEVKMSKAAAKSSDRDENCSEETPKTEENREHHIAKEVTISKGAAKSSNRDRDCTYETPKTELKRKRSVAKEVMMAKVGAKSSNIDGNSDQEIPKAGAKRRHTAGKELAPETSELGEQLAGSKIKVWWPLDETFYEGIVDSYDHIRRRHRILYFDGEEEKLDLKKERWELIEGAGGGQETDVFKLDSSPDTLRKKRKAEIEPAKEVKANSSSKRSSASAGASRTKSRKAGGNSDRTMPDEHIAFDESDESDIGTKQTTKVTMTTSKGRRPKVAENLPDVGRSSGECLDNLVAMNEGTKKKRSHNRVGSVDSEK